MRKLLPGLALLCSTAAYAQSGPQWPQGYIPKAFGTGGPYPSWESEWESKANYYPTAINILDYGAKCDGVTDDTAALNAAESAALGRWSAASSGSVITLPAGATCHIVSPNAFTVTSAGAITIEGNSATLLFDSAGMAITLSNLAATLVIRNLVIVHNSATVEGTTGLSILSTVFGNHVTLSNVSTEGLGGASGWQDGIHITTLTNPVLDRIYTLNNNADGVGLEISGQLGNLFGVDAKITNSEFQDGNIGVKVDGAVQGMFFANSEILGNNTGIYWHDSAGSGNSPQYFTVTNSHINTLSAGIDTDYISQILVSNVLFLEIGTNTGYFAIGAGDNQQVAITNNIINGNGGASSTAIRLSKSQLSSISGNSVVTFTGPCIDISNNVQSTAVSGNSCSGTASIAQDTSHTTNSYTGNLVNGVLQTVYSGNISMGLGGAVIFPNSARGNDAYINDNSDGTLYVGNASNPALAGVTAYQFKSTGSFFASAGATDGYVDAGAHRSSLNLAGVNNSSEAVSLSAASTSDGALIYYTDATRATRWGLFWADQANAVFHESFPTLSFDAGGNTGTLSVAASGIVARVPIALASYSSATLPACTAGQTAYAQAGRNPGEGAGAGTGTPIFCNNSYHWFAVWSGVAVTY